MGYGVQEAINLWKGKEWGNRELWEGKGSEAMEAGRAQNWAMGAGFADVRVEQWAAVQQLGNWGLLGLWKGGVEFVPSRKGCGGQAQGHWDGPNH